MNDTEVLVCEQVRKEFRDADRRLEVLSGVDLHVRSGETLAIVGASGSGKTTLLQILGGLDRPSGGRVRIAGQDMADLSRLSAARCATARSVSFTSFITCCPSSPRSRTSRCRCSCGVCRLQPRASSPRTCWHASDSRSGSVTGLHSCRVASDNVPPLHARS